MEKKSLTTIRCLVMYDGSKYDGWQRLAGNETSRTIQDIIEMWISKELKQEIKIHGSGRTDKGVHAYGQVFHFLCEGKISCSNLKKTLNHYLEKDIRILDIKYEENKFHSRYDAKRKTYGYHLVRERDKSVFTRKYTFMVSDKICLDKMRQGAKYLIGTNDYKGFSTKRLIKGKEDKKSTIRTIENIEIYEVCDASTHHKNQIRIDITGDGFLYNMVRIIVGTLVEIGEGEMEVECIKSILKEKNRELAGPTINYEGLFLKKVEY